MLLFSTAILYYPATMHPPTEAASILFYTPGVSGQYGSSSSSGMTNANQNIEEMNG